MICSQFSLEYCTTIENDTNVFEMFHVSYDIHIKISKKSISRVHIYTSFLRQKSTHMHCPRSNPYTDPNDYDVTTVDDINFF